MTVHSQLAEIVTPRTDLMASNSRTWAGIDLGPATPRLRASIASVYRDFVQTSKSDSERAYYQAQVAKWEAP